MSEKPEIPYHGLMPAEIHALVEKRFYTVDTERHTLHITNNQNKMLFQTSSKMETCQAVESDKDNIGFPNS